MWIKKNWIKELNVRTETVKLLEENIVEKLLDIDLSNNFLGSDTKSTSNKSKSKQVRVHHTKKLLHNKTNNQQNEKATYRMREYICKAYI